MNFISYFLSINIISLVLVFSDKKKAIHHKWRIAESTFFLLSLLGGCFGILIGMYLFHHKTKKLKFKLIPIICIIWILILYHG